MGIDIVLAEHTLSIVRHTSIVRSGFEFLGLTPEEQQHIAHSMGHS